MKITVHRGTNQIGGCVTEYECNGWRLFVDYGEQLPGAPDTDKPPAIEGLTMGDTSKSALLITHYHADHIDRITDLPKELPIYMGAIAKEIATLLSNHLSPANDGCRRMAERLETVGTFSPGKTFTFGEQNGKFKIVPIVMDHSAFDAYAFKIDADGVSMFHTGDFRTHGFRSGNLQSVIGTFVGQVDYVVCEATNVARPDATAVPERELQRQFESEFRNNKYNIVYLSSTNIDRLFGLYRSALRAGRPFLVDRYQKGVMDAVVDRGIWGKSPLYQYGKYEPTALLYDGNDFKVSQKFREFANEKGYVLIARANERFDRLIAQLPGYGKQKYLSMWKGYVDKTNKAYHPDMAQSLGTEFKYMHTSGHCDMSGLHALLELLNPKAIIPIHTDNSEAFARLFSDKWPVVLLKDGESVNPIAGKYSDNTDAIVFAVGKPDNNVSEIFNEGNYQWWATDQRHLGNFKNSTDALQILQCTKYAPDRLLGYSVETEEDLEPFRFDVYDADFNHISHYEWGAHTPGECKFQEMEWPKPGDMVWAVIREFDAVVPCEVVGSITEDFLKTSIETDILCSTNHNAVKEDMLDWDWDKVIVRPLVRLENEFDEMLEKMLVPRIYCFPYRKKSQFCTVF